MRIALIFLIILFCIYSVTSIGLHKKKKSGLVGGHLLRKPKLIGGDKFLKSTPKLFGKKGCKKPLGGKLKLNFGKLKGCKSKRCGRKLKLFRKKRSIGEIVSDISSRVFETFSNRLDSASRGLRNVGDQFHRGGDLVRNASLSTRIAGIMATDRIRRTSNGLFSGSSNDNNSAETNLIRRRRAARRPAGVPANFQLPAGKMTLEEMLGFVRQYNAEVCLQRVICELSANSNMYGDDGIRFGTKLLGYRQVSNAEAQRYKKASQVGNQYRGRPQQCSRKYPKSVCNYESTQLIAVGNSILH